jgi:hypothetical protein
VNKALIINFKYSKSHFLIEGILDEGLFCMLLLYFSFSPTSAAFPNGFRFLSLALAVLGFLGDDKLDTLGSESFYPTLFSIILSWLSTWLASFMFTAFPCLAFCPPLLSS